MASSPVMTWSGSGIATVPDQVIDTKIRRTRSAANRVGSIKIVDPDIDPHIDPDIVADAGSNTSNSVMTPEPDLVRAKNRHKSDLWRKRGFRLTEPSELWEGRVVTQDLPGFEQAPPVRGLLFSVAYTFLAASNPRSSSGNDSRPDAAGCRNRAGLSLKMTPGTRLQAGCGGSGPRRIRACRGIKTHHVASL